jgi:hypothetical protein
LSVELLIVKILYVPGFMLGVGVIGVGGFVFGGNDGLRDADDGTRKRISIAIKSRNVTMTTLKKTVDENSLKMVLMTNPIIPKTRETITKDFFRSAQNKIDRNKHDNMIAEE